MSDATKIFGLTAQIDFGNLAVGIGTLVVAAVTAWSVYSSRQSKFKEIQKVADSQIAAFRMKWNYDLRRFVARYLALHRQISTIKKASKTGTTTQKDRPLLIELFEIRSSIRMMLKENSEIEAEKELERLVSLDHPSDHSTSIETREKITVAARQVLKSVWSQAKTEIRS